MERLQRQGSQLVEMPPINYGAHILQMLWDIGPSKSNGMGLSPIDYTDIAAANDVAAMFITPWEAKLLRALSKEYSGGDQTMKDASCPAPYSPIIEATEDVRARVDRQFKSLVSGRRKK